MSWQVWKTWRRENWENFPRENFHLSHENVIVTVQFYVNVMKKAYFGSNVLKLSCRCKYHLNTLTVAKETVVLYSVYLLSYSPILSLWLFWRKYMQWQIFQLHSQEVAAWYKLTSHFESGLLWYYIPYSRRCSTRIWCLDVVVGCFNSFNSWHVYGNRMLIHISSGNCEFEWNCLKISLLLNVS